MKHLILVFLFLAGHEFLRAQVIFCPAGAEWNYSFVRGFPFLVENEKIKYVRDTVIGNIQAKVLAHKKFYTAYNPFNYKLSLIRQSGDTVFFRSETTQHTWQILYNFAALPGQSWQTTIQLDDINNSPPTLVTYTVSVDSVKTVTMNAMNLRRLFVTYLAPVVLPYQSVITERFGADPFMFNYSNQIDGSDFDVIYYFLCYRDNTFGLKQFTSYSCDYSDYVGLSTNAAETGLVLYPNPATDVLHVDNLSAYSFIKLEIADCLGEIKLNLEKEAAQNNIDISRLPAGLYLLKIFTGQKPLTFKFVKA